MSRSFTLLASQFPEYDRSTLPGIPDAWQDISWRNDACPSFRICDYIVWIDFPLAGDRERPESDRFALQRVSVENAAPAGVVDGHIGEYADWESLEAALLGEAFGVAFVRHFTSDVLAEVRRLNATPEYASDVCATHDFTDANMIAAEAFVSVYGRPVIGDDGSVSQEDRTRWNSAWAYAKKTYLRS